MTRIPRTEFAKIRAKVEARKARRASNAAFNASLAGANGAVGDREFQLGEVATKRARKPRTASRKDQIKALKKRGHPLWSLVVRGRDGHKCLMCGKTDNLNAHHWLFRKSHSVRLALDPANGATLCAYPCHLGRVHHDGDGDFILRLADKMTAIVGAAKVEEMRQTSRTSGPLSLEEIQEFVSRLEAALKGALPHAQASIHHEPRQGNSQASAKVEPEGNSSGDEPAKRQGGV